MSRERRREYGKGGGGGGSDWEREKGEEKLFYSRGEKLFSKIRVKDNALQRKSLKFHEIKFELEEKEN